MQFNIRALFAALLALKTQQAYRETGRHRHHSPPFKGKKRYRTTNAAGKRVVLPAGSPRPACPWTRSAPIVNGVRMRHEKGRLVSRLSRNA
jgi:hypothetical protein